MVSLPHRAKKLCRDGDAVLLTVAAWHTVGAQRKCVDWMKSDEGIGSNYMEGPFFFAFAFSASPAGYGNSQASD